MAIGRNRRAGDVHHRPTPLPASGGSGLVRSSPALADGFVDVCSSDDKLYGRHTLRLECMFGPLVISSRSGISPTSGSPAGIPDEVLTDIGQSLEHRTMRLPSRTWISGRVGPSAPPILVVHDVCTPVSLELQIGTRDHPGQPKAPLTYNSAFNGGAKRGNP